MWTAIGTIAAALIGGIATYFGTRKTNQTSQEISNNNIQFQKEENDITRLREDNAIQRSAADMESAGLSKTLAAGNPASASALTAPQDTRQYENPMQKAMEKMQLKETIMNLASLESNIKKQKAETENIEAQTAYQNTVTENYQEAFDNDQAVKLMTIEVGRAQIASYEASARLNNIIGDYKGAEIQSEIDYRLSQIDLINANIDKISEEIKTEVFKRYKLGEEALLVVQDIVNAKLKEKELQWNLDYAEKYNLPVGMVASGMFGSALTTGRSLGGNIKQMLSDWLASKSGNTSMSAPLPPVAGGGGSAW